MKTPRDLKIWIFSLGALVLLGALAWQGRHFSDSIPQWADTVAGLGVWGPIAFMLAVVLLCPIFFPDSVLGLLGGFVFGLTAGCAYFFVAIYAANLLIFAIARTWLRDPIMRYAEDRPKAQAILRGARRDALRLTLLIRLVPVNIAMVSYLLGAGHFSWRAALIGNLALMPQLFLAVYVGDLSNRAMTLATREDSTGYLEDVVMILGLLAAVIVVAVVTRIASRAVAELEAPVSPASEAGQARD